MGRYKGQQVRNLFFPPLNTTMVLQFHPVPHRMLMISQNQNNLEVKGEFFINDHTLLLVRLIIITFLAADNSNRYQLSG